MSDIIGALLLLSTLMFAYYKYIIGVIITAPLVFVYTLIKDYNVQQYHFAIDREIRFYVWRAGVGSGDEEPDLFPRGFIPEYMFHHRGQGDQNPIPTNTTGTQTI